MVLSTGQLTPMEVIVNYCLTDTSISLLRLFGLFATFTSAAYAGVCPAVGKDTDCAVIITVTDSGATVAFTGQGPFDGVEDTLVGVVNKSKLPLSSLGLTSSSTIFGFDGDGLSSYGIASNSMDSTGYGGPNAYFTKIDSSLKSGTVNFVNPVAANGGTAFFALEEALSAATACTDLINNAVTHSTGGNSTNGQRPELSASFTPNKGYTLQQAAQTCGLKDFNWQQKLLSVPKPSPFFAAGSSIPLIAPPPFNDPPPSGYSYQNPPNTAYPFYYNLFWPASNPLSLAANKTTTTLSFYDAPSDPCLPGTQSASVKTIANSLCKGKRALKGSKLAFSTHLVGVNSDNSLVDLGIGFDWTDTFNGTSGGLAVTNTSLHADPNSGSGGITIIHEQKTTTYSALGVTTINGSQSGATKILPSGGQCNGVFTGNFAGDIIISNGQNCSFVNGNITGNIFNYGGRLSLSGTAVSGNVNNEQGIGLSISTYSVIEGNLIVHNTSSLAEQQSSLCSSTVYGNVLLQHNGGTFQLGSLSPSVCDGNVIGGNAEIENNSGAINLANNFVNGNLQCQGNSTITGSQNSGGQKVGQCATF